MSALDELLAASGLPAGEARLLAAHGLRVDRAWIVAHGADAVPAQQALALASLFARRRAGEPVAYITAEREFYGLSLGVTPEVLIPRPETEQVVEIVLALIAERAAPRVLDLGTGSGAIAIAVARARADAALTATDVRAASLAVARANAARHAAKVQFVECDWFDALGGERFDVVACNPPYVASGDPHLAQGDLRFEPRTALDGGADGMDSIRRIAADTRGHLAGGGWLVIEHGYDQGPACVRLLAGLGYTHVRDACDLSGLPRVCVGRFDAPQRSG